MSERPWTSGPWELRNEYVCLPLPEGVAPEDDDTPPLFDIDTWEATQADGELVALAPEMAEAILEAERLRIRLLSTSHPEVETIMSLHTMADRLRKIGNE